MEISWGGACTTLSIEPDKCYSSIRVSIIAEAASAWISTNAEITNKLKIHTVNKDKKGDIPIVLFK